MHPLTLNGQCENFSDETTLKYDLRRDTSMVQRCPSTMDAETLTEDRNLVQQINGQFVCGLAVLHMDVKRIHNAEAYYKNMLEDLYARIELPTATSRFEYLYL